VAAVVSAALLVGGGVGGYFVGVADDEDRPGAGRFGDHRPGDWPGFRERGPERPFNR
jgi:hypothetical protein